MMWARKDLNDLLGKQVSVVLSHDGEEDAIAHGQFLGYGEGGEVQLLCDDGFVHHCWPLLDIKPRQTAE